LIVTVQEVTTSNMLEIEALRESLFEKEVITEGEFITNYIKLDREVKGRRSK
jgi:hypothetical protein